MLGTAEIVRSFVQRDNSLTAVTNVGITVFWISWVIGTAIPVNGEVAAGCTPMSDWT